MGDINTRRLSSLVMITLIVGGVFGIISEDCHSSSWSGDISLSDTEAPVISVGPEVTPSVADGDWTVNLTATIDDSGTGNSPILTAEYWVNSVGVPGSGTPMNAADGMYDSPTEDVTATINITGWSVGTYDLYVGGADIVPNWMDAGSYAVVSLTVEDTTEPCVQIVIQQGWVNASESLYVTALIRDSTSGVKDPSNVTIFYRNTTVNDGWPWYDYMTFSVAEQANGYWEYDIPSISADPDVDMEFYIAAWDTLDHGPGETGIIFVDVVGPDWYDYQIYGYVELYDGTAAGGYSAAPANDGTQVVIEWEDSQTNQKRTETTTTSFSGGYYSKLIDNIADGQLIYVNATSIANPNFSNTYAVRATAICDRSWSGIRINLTGGIPDHVEITQPADSSDVTSGVPFAVEYTVCDENGVTAEGYYGTLNLISSDASGIMPPDKQLDGTASSTPGTITTTATLFSTGPQTLNLTDTGPDLVARNGDEGERMPFGTPDIWWDEITLNVLSSTLPDAPEITDIKLAGSSSENVEITFDASSDDGGGADAVTEYKIYCSVNGGGFEEYGSLPATDSASYVWSDFNSGDGDGNFYNYTIYAFDGSGGLLSLGTAVHGKTVIPLAGGDWNLISIPLVQYDNSLAAVFETVGEGIQAYDGMNKEWKTWDQNKPAHMNDLEPWMLTQETHKLGFWVKTGADDYLINVGKVCPSDVLAEKNINLYTGWNLVGYPTFTPATVATAFSGIGSNYALKAFDSSSPDNLKCLSDSDMIYPGMGYWVWVDSDTIWTVDW